MERDFQEKGYNYISDHCESWNEAYGNKDMINSKSCILVKYEDFIEDKISFIEDLCTKLNLPLKNKAFQPEGNRQINIEDFFGDNFNTIQIKCNFIKESYYD